MLIDSLLLACSMCSITQLKWKKSKNAKTISLTVLRNHICFILICIKSKEKENRYIYTMSFFWYLVRVQDNLLEE